MTIDLKPCPRCGSRNIIREPFTPRWAVILWRNVCEDCGYKATGGRTAEEAAEQWNRRAGGADGHPEA